MLIRLFFEINLLVKCFFCLKKQVKKQCRVVREVALFNGSVIPKETIFYLQHPIFSKWVYQLHHNRLGRKFRGIFYVVAYYEEFDEDDLVYIYI